MKKISFYILACTLALTVAACSTKELLPAEEEQPQEAVAEEAFEGTAIWASLDNSSEDGTKSTLSGTKVVWEAGDEIMLIQVANPEVNMTFTLSEGAGTANGKFVSDAPLAAGTYNAIYPASVCAGIVILDEVQCYKINLPAVQTYREGSYPQKANIAVASSPIVYTGADANRETDPSLVFKNVGGLLKINLTGSKSIKKITVTAESGKFLSGDKLFLSTLFPTSLEAIGSYSGPSGSVERNYVTLDCSNGGSGVALSGTAKPFYIYLPSGALNAGFNVEIVDTENQSMFKFVEASKTQNVIGINTITEMPDLAYAQEVGVFAQSYVQGVYNDKAGSSDLKVGKNQIQMYMSFDPANNRSTNSLQDFTGANPYAVQFTFPTNLNLGGVGAMTLKTLGTAPSGKIGQAEDVKLIKKDGVYRWFVGQTTGYGYVFMTL